MADKDVDISSSAEIEWAVATRFQADRDLMVVAGALGKKLDRTTDNGISAKMGLDATAPSVSASRARKRSIWPLLCRLTQRCGRAAACGA